MSNMVIVDKDEIETILAELDKRLDDSLRRAMSRAEHVRLTQIASLIDLLKTAMLPDKSTDLSGYDYGEREDPGE